VYIIFKNFVKVFWRRELVVTPKSGIDDTLGANLALTHFIGIGFGGFGFGGVYAIPPD